ncbi:inovirus Gp2 family protein [Acinetobacter sp. NIPH1876]|uniref:YagK/YfjJ domain-containing protein n=1 Tax=Acinetobacter TaxID=469 RepID=UPI001F4A4CC2|nr:MULTISPECIES: inovirus-type Gp2 protein [Acinetobacter]MCH7305246.1 inovirus Gp2 family protein [Acinetobacter higginsii]MCJ0829867.1 inovirus Gp2 family protein [Acinetobacter sp. NIPH1876]
MKFENTSSSEICEANLSIEIEDFIKSSLHAKRQPRSFYKNFCELLLDFDQVYNPDFSYSSLLQLFCNLLYEYHLDLDSPIDLLRCLKRRSFDDWQRYFNKMKSDHLNERRQHRYNESLNAEKLDRRLTELTESYKALLVVSIELSYITNVNIQRVQDDLEHFLRKVNRSKYGNDVLLLVWALEQGSKSKGYHYHVVFILNERNRIEAWKIANDMGELWEDITDGDGCYFNCHDRRYLKRYEENGMVGIGIIYSNLKYQVDRMRAVLLYLARPKKEQYLRIKATKKMKTFGMSQR